MAGLRLPAPAVTLFCAFERLDEQNVQSDLERSSKGKARACTLWYVDCLVSLTTRSASCQ